MSRRVLGMILAVAYQKAGKKGDSDGDYQKTEGNL
jgi:hypothetical protein